jgi:hypothetical protein
MGMRRKNRSEFEAKCLLVYLTRWIKFHKCLAAYLTIHKDGRLLFTVIPKEGYDQELDNALIGLDQMVARNPKFSDIEFTALEIPNVKCFA